MALEDILACPICLDQFENPKILSCHHSFCRECLGKNPQELEQGKYILTCPTCRKPTQLPDGGVPALPPSFLINNLIELHRSKEKPEQHPENIIICDEHQKPQDIFCEECGVVVCHVCAIRGHRNHEYNLINDCFDKNVHPIQARLDQIKLKIADVSLATKNLDEADIEIIEQEHSIEETVNSTADQLLSFINQYRQKLLLEAKLTTERKRAMIQIQREEAKKMVKTLQASKESVECLLQAGSRKHILESKIQALVKLDSAYMSVNIECLEPAEQPNMQYKPNRVSIDGLGEIQASHVSDSFQAVNNSIVVKCNKEVGIEIKHMPKSGLQFKPFLEMFSIQLVAKGMHDTCVEVHFIIQQKSECILYFFAPNTCGSYKLIVEAGGHPILGSPLNCRVLPDLKPVRVIDNITTPHSVAVMKDGTLAVTETKRNRVHVFYPNGEARIFACNNPMGISSTPDGELFVATGEVIRKFGINGNLISESQFDKKRFFKDKTKILDNPHSVTVYKNRLYVTDTVNDRVHIANLGLDHCLQIKNHDFMFMEPNKVEIDSEENMFVTSRWNNTVVKIEKDTSSYQTFGSKGSGEGQLRHPTGLAIDKDDVVYVADTDNHRISVFDSNGQFLTCFGKKGSELGELNGPCGVAVDNNGNVYVCDTGNDRIVLYQ